MKTEKITKSVRLFLAGLCMVMGLNFVTAPLVAHAAAPAPAPASTFDTTWIGGPGNGAFDDATLSVQKAGNDLYKLMMTVGVVGLLVCIIVCGISIAVSGGNGNKRGEKLGWMLWIGFGGCIIFGSISIIGLFQNVGTNLF